MANLLLEQCRAWLKTVAQALLGVSVFTLGATFLALAVLRFTKGQDFSVTTNDLPWPFRPLLYVVFALCLWGGVQVFRLFFPHLFSLRIGFWSKLAWSCALLLWPIGGPAIYYIVMFPKTNGQSTLHTSQAARRREEGLRSAKRLGLAFLFLLASGVAELIRTRVGVPMSGIALLFAGQVLLGVSALALIAWSIFGMLRTG